MTRGGHVHRKFKPPFSERRYIAEPASMSIVGAISEICGFASVASGGAAVGNVRSVPDRAARSYSERAPPSARLGNGFRLVRLSGIDRIAAPAPSAGRGSVGPDE